MVTQITLAAEYSRCHSRANNKTAPLLVRAELELSNEDHGADVPQAADLQVSFEVISQDSTVVSSAQYCGLHLLANKGIDVLESVTESS